MSEEKTINKKCIKCGGNDANINFSPASEHVILNGNSYQVRDCIQNKSTDTMVVMCKACGYVWEEKPLDLIHLS